MELKFKYFVFLNVLDVLTTYMALSRLSLNGLNELNPVYSYAFSNFGLIMGLVAIKLIGLIVLSWLILQIPLEIKIKQFYNMDGRQIGLLLICTMFAFVVLNNSYQIISTLNSI